ncbi:eukaryotic translation initiation factor 4E-binding protein 1-like [Ruditapes philippinarum]|uniref:eukaryotic translation initiation factor 4E-binding protein 1-like n=1 Tax=Ruditapes philippinarum TaxID=129788 RepID=UPI00295B8502|nr:eukaryotic translation initiation factor 4E-binding protein 1-like [Ruditapes philippinarum]
MSQKASPQKTMTGREIPNRRIADISNLPADYSTTPGGSIFSTTPGGTRIFYERSFLMKCRESPLAKTPPANMANIPGVTSPGNVDAKENGVQDPKPTIVEKVSEENPQFEMDI